MRPTPTMPMRSLVPWVMVIPSLSLSRSPCAELNATSTLSSRPSEARAGTYLSAHACVASWVPGRPAGVRDDNEKFQGGWPRWHERSRPGLQHRGERLGRIGKIADVDRHAPLDQPARGGDVALRIDPDRIGEARTVEVEQHHGIGTDLA